MKKRILAEAVMLSLIAFGAYSAVISAQPQKFELTGNNSGSKSALIPDGAYQINFSNKKFPKEQLAVYQFFKKDLDELNLDADRVKKFGKTSKSDVSVDLYDLDEDGTPEIFAMISAYPTFCWGTGCSYVIFKQDNKKHLLKLFETGGKATLYAGPEISNHYKDLVFYDDIATSKVSVWQWNGKNYILDKETK